jgi:hypothetical protein
MTKVKPVVVPKFSSEAEEAAWWDDHRSDIEAEMRRRMRRPLTLGGLKKLDGPKGKPSEKEQLGRATAHTVIAAKGIFG